MAESSAVAIVKRDQIIERVANGAMLHQIASDLDIAPCSISKHLADDPEYRKAREIGAEIRLHLAYQRVDQIAELGVEKDGRIKGITQQQGNLARVRESTLKAAQWFAEREFPHRWGAKSTQTLDIAGGSGQQIASITVQFVQAPTGRVIEHDGPECA